MKVIRFVLSLVLAAAFLFGVSSFSPQSACGGTMPGGCKDASAVNVDMTIFWLDTGRILAGMFG